MGHLRAHMDRQRQGRQYAAVDGAVLDGLLEPLYALGRARFACLLPGGANPDIAHVAPYLFEIDAESPMVDWLETRLDLPWGYLLASPLPLRRLHLHLRPFSQARGLRGEELVFRFWDPRVFRSMAAILTPSQAEAFMDGITAVFLPGRDGFERVYWDGQQGVLRFSGHEQQVETGAAHHAGV